MSEDDLEGELKNPRRPRHAGNFSEVRRTNLVTGVRQVHPVEYVEPIGTNHHTAGLAQQRQ